MKSFRHVVRHARFSPLEISLLIPLTAFLYTLFEWLFIISKQSFMNTAGIFEKLGILLNSTAILSIFAILTLVPAAILYFVIKQKTVRGILRFFLCLAPAMIMACTILLLVDNTTYTLTEFGVVSTKGIFRVLYLIGFILLTLALLLPVYRTAHAIEKSRRKTTAQGKLWFPAILGLVLLLCAGLPMLLNPDYQAETAQSSMETGAQKMPNVILITGDGINAAKLSLYGYEKDTTPFLKELAGTSLVAENAFSNAQGTIGSTTSLLTGKYPSDTRILASTDILKGEDAYEHLPGLLKDYGYYTVQMTFSYYADAYRINFQDAFDEANGESPVTNKVQSLLAKRLPSDYYYFLREEFSRISDRLEHLFYIKQMTNPFLQVTESPEKFNDQQKLDYLFKLLQNSDQPVFVHIHWMGTHGPKYYPATQVFSAGVDPKTQGKYEENFYLDSILEFDSGIKQVYDFLESHDQLDQTVLVVGSDHTQRWTTARIPMLFHFPENQNAGLVTSNTQNLDIAPTLLDYLDIAQPDWMQGQSLLTPLDPERPIFQVAIPDSKRDPKTNKIVYPEAKAPYYQFGKATVIICDHYYQVVLWKGTLNDSTVSGYHGVCQKDPPSRKQALSMIIAHLAEYGFDTSALAEIEP